MKKFRTKEEVKYLTDQIQDNLQALEEEYTNRKKALLDRAKEIQEQEIEEEK